LVDTRQEQGEARKGHRHEPVQKAVEKSAFERNQKEAAAYAVRRDGKVRRVGPESTEGRLEGR
jgi:hypothetical protein